MDIKDFDSPLRGLLNSPIRRITPAVPVPDWNRNASHSNSSSSIPSPLITRLITPPLPNDGGHQPSIHNISPFTSPDPNSLRSSVISCSPSLNHNPQTQLDTSHRDGVNTNIQNDLSHIPGAVEVSQSKSGPVHLERLANTPSRISGEVSLIPNTSSQGPSSQNPHTLMVAQTPIASGPSQAINSIKLQNCVATVNLCTELKLLDIYCRTRFSEYNPSRFHGVVMKILEPRATALIFKSGKVVCTGTKNEHDSLLATKKFARIIQKLGFPVRFTEFKIQNFVATADLRFPVRLEALQQTHGQFTSYEPELFPGLVYRMVRPRIVLLIFVNGKIVFTGARSREDITESLNIIYPILRSFKKN